MTHEVVRTLVSFSMGTERQSKNGTYYHYPYGKKAATSTKAFKQIPDAWFAVTLATMYPFVVRDRAKWSTMLDKFAHPLTGLWPWGVLKRHINFRSRISVTRDSLFEAYERNGGTYHGNEAPDVQVAATRGRNNRRSTQQIAAAMSGDDSDSLDDVFQV